MPRSKLSQLAQARAFGHAPSPPRRASPGTTPPTTPLQHSPSPTTFNNKTLDLETAVEAVSHKGVRDRLAASMRERDRQHLRELSATKDAASGARLEMEAVFGRRVQEAEGRCREILEEFSRWRAASESMKERTTEAHAAAVAELAEEKEKLEAALRSEMRVIEDELRDAHAEKIAEVQASAEGAARSLISASATNAAVERRDEILALTAAQSEAAGAELAEQKDALCRSHAHELGRALKERDEQFAVSVRRLIHARTMEQDSTMARVKESLTAAHVAEVAAVHEARNVSQAEAVEGAVEAVRARIGAAHAAQMADVGGQLEAALERVDALQKAAAQAAAARASDADAEAAAHADEVELLSHYNETIRLVKSDEADAATGRAGRARERDRMAFVSWKLVVGLLLAAPLLLGAAVVGGAAANNRRVATAARAAAAQQAQADAGVVASLQADHAAEVEAMGRSLAALTTSCQAQAVGMIQDDAQFHADRYQALVKASGKKLGEVSAELETCKSQIALRRWW